MKKKFDGKILSGSDVTDRDLHLVANNDLYEKISEVNLQNHPDSKKLESMLEACEKKYRTFFENSLDAILITSQDGSVQAANLATCNMLGWDEKDICRLERNGFVAQNTELEMGLRTLRESGIFFGELTFIKKDGTRFPVEISSSVFTDYDGSELRAIIARDITERKKSEEKIHTAALYARTLIEASLDPLVTISSDGKITDVNFATEQITGINRDKLIGSEFADYFLEADKAREGYNLVFLNGEVKNYPLTIRHKDGQTADVLYNATLFKNEAGEVQGVFAAARDITIRKKTEEKLRKSKKLLEKLNQHLTQVRENERSQIAMNLHDDLGQKLTALYLDIAWLKSRIGVQSNSVRKKLEDINSEINETIESIKEISSFLRPAILYDLGLVPAITSQLTKFEKQSGIRCYFYYGSDEFDVDNTISLIFFRIIQESLTNIARHSGASALELSLKRLENAIEMIIKDDGVGINNSKVESLASMGIQGIRERVKSAHGVVSIKGEKGSGTTIRVAIPYKKSKA
jgi:PAS domain S-box-containing protein